MLPIARASSRKRCLMYYRDGFMNQVQLQYHDVALPPSLGMSLAHGRKCTRPEGQCVTFLHPPLLLLAYTSEDDASTSPPGAAINCRLESLELAQKCCGGFSR